MVGDFNLPNPQVAWAPWHHFITAQGHLCQLDTKSTTAFSEKGGKKGRQLRNRCCWSWGVGYCWRKRPRKWWNQVFENNRKRPCHRVFGWFFLVDFGRFEKVLCCGALMHDITACPSPDFCPGWYWMWEPRWTSRSRCILWNQFHKPRKTPGNSHFEPKNGGLVQMTFPFQTGDFQVPC